MTFIYYFKDFKMTEWTIRKVGENYQVTTQAGVVFFGQHDKRINTITDIVNARKRGNIVTVCITILIKFWVI